ncbi:MAG TPA: adhesin, partial [Halothiobacillaceae bacterium]|nr:adhesin [Halothiobacillaceae bacterium]
GYLGFREGGKILLGSVMSGEVATTRYVVVNAKNDASLLGNAFANASGNIGVNVASGTGNLQSNALSMAVACNTCAGGTGGGEQ